MFHIRMNFEGSCDTEHWSNDADIYFLCYHRNKLKKIYIIKLEVILNCNYISQHFCFYCTFDQIKAALASIRKKTSFKVFKKKSSLFQTFDSVYGSAYDHRKQIVGNQIKNCCEPDSNQHIPHENQSSIC